MNETTTPSPDPEKDVPDWAIWLRRQLNGVNLVIGGLVIVVVALIGLWNSVPSISNSPDCSNYAALSIEEKEICDTQAK